MTAQQHEHEDKTEKSASPNQPQEPKLMPSGSVLPDDYYEARVNLTIAIPHRGLYPGFGDAYEDVIAALQQQKPLPDGSFVRGDSKVTKQLKCEGSSDDTFGVYGAGPDDDYDNCANGKPIAFRVHSKSEDAGLLVVGQYAPVHCSGWLIGVSPDEHPDYDDALIPDWPMRIERGEADYSPRLVIDAPDDVTVEYVP